MQNSYQYHRINIKVKFIKKKDMYSTIIVYLLANKISMLEWWNW